MSRLLRRVPVDFDWPLRKTWEGYVLPQELRLPPCPDCTRGSTPAFDWVETLASRLAMLAEDIPKQEQTDRPLHPWLANDPYPPAWSNREPLSRTGLMVEYEVARPTPDIIELVCGLTDQTPAEVTSSWGTSRTSFRIVQALIKAAGLPERWGYCPTCDGEMNVGTPEQLAAVDAWEPTDPPTGAGWQLWETTSEGSPVSPVFATAASLIHWMVTASDSYAGYSHEAARAFVNGPGWAPSFVQYGDGPIIDGVAALDPTQRS